MPDGPISDATDHIFTRPLPPKKYVNVWVSIDHVTREAADALWHFIQQFEDATNVNVTMEANPGYDTIQEGTVLKVSYPSEADVPLRPMFMPGSTQKEAELQLNRPQPFNTPGKEGH